MSDKHNYSLKYMSIWLVLCVFISFVLYLIYQSQFDIELDALKRAEANFVNQMSDEIEYEVSQLITDLRYLSNLSALRDFIETPDHEGFHRLNERLLSELQLRSDKYLQLRFIGMKGKEIARVDRINGVAKKIPFKELQDKSDRYYVKAALELPNDTQIYLSPIDLNIDKGKVTDPYQPVIRAALKIYRKEQAIGILVINYDMSRLLKAFDKHPKNLWLIDQEGYWLAGAETFNKWNLNKNNPGTRFQDEYPTVWEKIANNSNIYQSLSRKGLVTHSCVCPNTLLGGNGQDQIKDSYQLHVISLITGKELTAFKANITNPYVFLYVVFVIIIAGSLYLLYRSWRFSEKSEEQAQHSRLKFMQLIEFIPDAMVVCDPRGKIILVNKHTEDMFGYPRSALINQPVNTLIPKELRKGHDKHIRSYVKSPTVRPMGQDGYELKARRKDGSEFSVSISLGPVDSGEDMLIVCNIREHRI